MAEVRLAEAAAVLDVLKAPGPASLENVEKHLAGRAARAMGMGVELADVLRDLSIARSTYHDQAGGCSRAPTRGAQGACAPRSRPAAAPTAPRACGPTSGAAGASPCPGATSSRATSRRPSSSPEKVVRAIMAEEGLVAAKARQMRRRARYSSYAGERGERPPNLPLREDDSHDFSSPEPGLLVVTDVTEFALDGYRAYLSPAIDCFDGRPVCWTVSEHPDRGLVLGMLRGLVGGSAADRGAPAHRAHRRRGAST